MHRSMALADARAGRGRSGVPPMGRVLVVADDLGARDMIIGHLTGQQCVAPGSKPADLARHLHHHPFSLGDTPAAVGQLDATAGRGGAPPGAQHGCRITDQPDP